MNPRTSPSDAGVSKGQSLPGPGQLWPLPFTPTSSHPNPPPAFRTQPVWPSLQRGPAIICSPNGLLHPDRTGPAWSLCDGSGLLLPYSNPLNTAPRSGQHPAPASPAAVSSRAGRSLGCKCHRYVREGSSTQTSISW